MLVNFFNCQGKVYQHVRPPKRWISKEYYKMVLERLLDHIWWKWPELLLQWIFLSRQCSAVYSYCCTKVARVPQQWSVEATTTQPGPRTVWFLVVFVVETWIEWLELQNRCLGDSGNPDDLWTHSKEGVWNLKKWVERMEACLTANRRYFEKENVKCTALENEDDASE